jgi:hypothetical protein
VPVVLPDQSAGLVPRPEPGHEAQVGKLLEGSPINAADIADYIHRQVAAGEFLIMPHEAGRQAWELKRQAPERLYQEMAEMAVKMRAKAVSR